MSIYKNVMDTKENIFPFLLAFRHMYPEFKDSTDEQVLDFFEKNPEKADKAISGALILMSKKNERKVKRVYSDKQYYRTKWW